MNLDKLRLWVDDLRTTKDPQVQGALSTLHGDCCLGRLCKVAIADGLEVDVVARQKHGGLTRIVVGSSYDGEAKMPPPSVRKWLYGYDPTRTHDDELVRLSLLNDSGKRTFAEIGDYLATTYGLDQP